MIREDCFKTTLVHLTERFNGKEVFLVGSVNSSTMLAQRTKKLIEEVKPDEVMVMANDVSRLILESKRTGGNERNCLSLSTHKKNLICTKVRCASTPTSGRTTITTTIPESSFSLQECTCTCSSSTGITVSLQTLLQWFQALR